jgi:hypothetical protein
MAPTLAGWGYDRRARKTWTLAIDGDAITLRQSWLGFDLDLRGSLLAGVVAASVALGR